MKKLITNCYIISPEVELYNATIEIDGQYIKKIYKNGEKLPNIKNIFDADGQMVMPGFIDIHSHGAAGFDITDDDPNAVNIIAEAKLKEGVTTYCPTTLTLPEKQLAATMTKVAEYKKTEKFVKIAGVHLEGPYLNKGCLGAQNPAFVRSANIEEVQRLKNICPVSQVTFAVEEKGGTEFVQKLLYAGIIPSCGHSGANAQQFAEGYDVGLRHLTHFCNQMTPLHHREIGLVGSGLFYEDVNIEIICDKIHLCPDMISLIFKLKPTEHIMVITDSMRASHLPDGHSSIGGLDVEVKNGVARLASNGALAGSTLKMNDGLKNIYEVTGLPLFELIKTVSTNQARELKLTDLGKIEPRYKADLVVLDDDFQVKNVFINGEQRL